MTRIIHRKSSILKLSVFKESFLRLLSAFSVMRFVAFLFTKLTSWLKVQTVLSAAIARGVWKLIVIEMNSKAISSSSALIKKIGNTNLSVSHVLLKKQIFILVKIILYWVHSKVKTLTQYLFGLDRRVALSSLAIKLQEFTFFLRFYLILFEYFLGQFSTCMMMALLRRAFVLAISTSWLKIETKEFATQT